MTDTKLFVCETCVRDRRLAPSETSRGRQLADRVLALCHTGGAGAPPLGVRVVACLRGCPSPCNATLQANGKTALRLSRLSPDHAAALLQLAERYLASADGDIAAADWPPALRGRLSARIPPPAALKP